MNDSVIISSIGQRIEYYANSAGVNNTAIKSYIKKHVTGMHDNITQSQVLYVERLLESFNLAMGEKRTTEKMYLERDLKILEDLNERLFSFDKNKGRNFVNTMRQNPITNNFSVNEVSDNGMNNTSSKTLTKVNSASNAYKMYNDNIRPF